MIQQAIRPSKILDYLTNGNILMIQLGLISLIYYSIAVSLYKRITALNTL